MAYQIPFIVALVIFFAVVYAGNARKKNLKSFQANQKIALVLSQEILELVNMLQKHRGMSSAILGGNDDFRGAIKQLDDLIQQKLTTILSEVTVHNELFETEVWSDIKYRWDHRCYRWDEFEMLKNIENHSFLIQIILDQINLLSDRAGLTASSEEHSNLLAREVLREMPEMVEHIGQMRAFSVYCAAMHGCSTDSKLHLMYLSRSVSESINRKNSVLQVPDRLDKKVRELLDLIKQDIVESKTVSINPDAMFDLCTRVIDDYLSLSKGSIAKLKHLYAFDKAA